MGLFKKQKKEIPKSDVELRNATPMMSSEAVFIKSTEEINKTDGVVIIGTINQGTVTPSNIAMPAQIDVEARRQAVLQNKKEKAKKKIKNSKENRKASTITSLIVLVVIALLGATFYFFKTTQETEGTLELKTLTLELGSTVPTNVSDYVKKENIDELQFTLDNSTIDINKVGEYKFKVTHNGKTSEGIAKVVDTIKPTATAQDLVILRGQSLNSEDFITSCEDLSGCTTQFENAQMSSYNQNPGDYEVFIVISDAHNNTDRKKANLKVADKYEKLTCMQETDSTENFGYMSQRRVELIFTDDTYYSHQANSRLQYMNKLEYNKIKSTYKDNEIYAFDDENMIVTIQRSYNLTEGYLIADYKTSLEQDGYLCTLEIKNAQ